MECENVDSPIGRLGARKVQPESIIEMSSVNVLIRLMNAGEGQENWIDKYVRYKNNKDQMMREVDAYHLTEKQKKALEKYIGETYWIGISQEQMMRVLMDTDLAGFSLKEANSARKTVSKKRMKEIPKFKEKVFASTEPSSVHMGLCGCARPGVKGKLARTYLFRLSAGYLKF